MKEFFVYILSGRSRVLYVGVTSDLPGRLEQHRMDLGGFTSRYRVHRLVYFEQTTDAAVAISREKQIKSWARKKKVALIAQFNPTWRDLSEDWRN